MKDKDSKLLWESYIQSEGFDDMNPLAGIEDEPETGMDTYSNKFRGPGAPGVNLARGFLLQALELIEDDDVHLCADAGALDTTIEALQLAINALQHNIEDVPGNEIHETRTAPKGKHYTKQGALKSGDADADGDGGPKFRSDPTDKPGKGD